MFKKFLIGIFMLNILSLNAMEKDHNETIKRERSASSDDESVTKKLKSWLDDYTTEDKEERFIGTVPPKLEAIIYAINNNMLNSDPILIELVGGHKTGKTLLAKEFAKRTNASLQIMYATQFLKSVKEECKNDITADDAVNNLMGNHESVKTFRDISSKEPVLIYCLKNIEQIITHFKDELPMLTSNITDGLLDDGLLDREDDDDNNAVPKKIIFLATSSTPILGLLIKNNATNAMHVVRSMEVDAPSFKDRQLLWKNFIEKKFKQEASKVDIETLAKKSEGFSGYHIGQAVKGAALMYNYKKTDLAEIIGQEIEEQKKSFPTLNKKEFLSIV